jgi:hypothetical protein
MSEKSHVGMGHSICPVCGIKHDEVVLLSTRIIFGKLQESLERDNFMGFALCPEHEAMREEYLALVEIKATPHGSTVKAEEVHNHRTGAIAHVHRSAVKAVLGIDLPDGVPFTYVEEGVIAGLQAMTEATVCE